MNRRWFRPPVRITSGSVMNPQKTLVDQKVAGQGTLQAGLESLEMGPNPLEEDSLVVGHGFSAAGQDSPRVRQGSLQETKGSLSPLSSRGSLSRGVTEPVSVVGHLGHSSKPDQILRIVQGPMQTGHSFRSLPVILVFLLTAIDFTSVGHCQPNQEDLISKAALAKAIFVGECVGQAIRQEPTVEGLWAAEFKVEEPLKGADLLSKRRILVAGLSREVGEKGCAGGNFTTGRKYAVFLNDSAVDQISADADETDGQRRIHWTLGVPVEYSKATKKMIEKYSCPGCAKSPSVKPMPIFLPPIDRSDPLIMRCRSSGRPTPKITWFKGTEVISIDGKRIKTSRDGSQLNIRRVKPTDAGLYKCQASNALGSINSSSVNVTVKASAETSSSAAGHAKRCDQRIYYCLNHGTCFTIATIGQFCACPHGFTGPRCQDRDHVGEVKPPPEMLMDRNLRNLFIGGLILIALILLVLAVIAYCLAMTRYDNARRMSHGAADDAESDVRPNGALLRSLNGLQAEKLQKFTATNGSGDSVDDKRVGLPQVLVTLIEEEDRTRTTTTSGKGELPSGQAKRPEMRLYCPTDQCPTIPNLSRPRLAAVSTTPSSAASSINLHMDVVGATAVEERLESC